MLQTQQLTFSLPYRTTYTRESFLLSQCNEEAVRWIDKYPHWNTHAVLVYGDKGCGKSLLAHIFSNTIYHAASLPEIPENLEDKIVIENLEELKDETLLFHWYNHTKNHKKGLLITSSCLPNFKLKDLSSRFSTIPKIHISPPDEILLFGVLYKSFSEKHIHIDIKVLEYIVTHIPRTFEAVQKIIKEADEFSLAYQRPVTIPMIKKMITDLF